MIHSYNIESIMIFLLAFFLFILRIEYLDIISDMDLTSTPLGSKEAVSFINSAFKNFVRSSLHSGMYKKSKLKYIELKEDFAGSL